MKDLERRLRRLEEKLKEPEEEPNPLIIYGPDDPGGARAIAEFEAKYPNYDGALFVLPDNGRDEDSE